MDDGEPMMHYCTFFDRNYFSRGLALYHSLVRHSPAFMLWILCFDDETYRMLSKMKLGNVRPIRQAELEKGDSALLQAKRTRSRVEYYFTCTPSLPLYIFNCDPEVGMVTYLDADLFFYDSPAPIYEELGNDSIAIIEHRFPPHLQHQKMYGTYNVGLLVFRRTEHGLTCLRWWRDRCIEWCYDRVEDGRFADQKYLDDWPSRFEGVRVVQHKGAGLAPWNLSNYQLRLEKGQVFVDGEPLIFYHFHGLKAFTCWLYDPGIKNYGHTMHPILKRQVYLPYVRELQAASRLIRSACSEFSSSNSIRYGTCGLRALIDTLVQRSFLIVTDFLVL